MTECPDMPIVSVSWDLVCLLISDFFRAGCAADIQGDPGQCEGSGVGQDPVHQ